MGNRVERVQTNVSQNDVISAMIEAWKELFGTMPYREQIALLLSQNDLETGHRKSMWNYNIGNITTNGKGTYDYFDNLTTSEQTSPGVWKKMRLKYRAYPSLIEGAKDYLQFLSSGRYQKSWQNVLHPDPAAFAKSLKDAGYYTADEAPYSEHLSSLFKQYTSTKEHRPDADHSHYTQKTHTNNEGPGVKGRLITQLNKMLDSYLSAFANKLPSNNYLIKISSKNIYNSAEFSRILCEALEEEFGVRTYSYTDNKDIEIECAANLDKKNIELACNEVLNMFEKSAGVYDIKTELLDSDKSRLKFIDYNKSSNNYRMFRINQYLVKG